MKRKELTCIVCPNGCPLEIDFEEDPVIRIIRIEGHTCDKGPGWAEQELTRPMRTISSNILVEDGDFPLVSVRTDAAIPKKNIFRVMAEIQSTTVKAPVSIGDKLIQNPGGTDCNIIATRHVNAVQPAFFGNAKAENSATSGNDWSHRAESNRRHPHYE